MGIDAIKATSINTMPQFKATTEATTTKPETKENGNALLYGSITALALVGAGLMYARSKKAPKDFANLKNLGYKFENKTFVDKNGKKFTGSFVKKDATVTFKDGVMTKSVIKPKEGNATEIINTFDEAGKIKTKTTKLKDGGEYKELKTTIARENDKVTITKEGIKADGSSDKIETITRQKNGDKLQITKETTDKDGKMIQESKELTIKKAEKKPAETTAEKPAENPAEKPAEKPEDKKAE